MKAIITVTARFSYVDNGSVRLFSDNKVLSYPAWERYLACFEEVYLLVRAKQVGGMGDLSCEATGPGVSAIPLPYFEGPWRFALKYISLRRRLREELSEMDDAALIFRLPCSIGFTAISLVKGNRPYAVEVVGDPWDVFSPGAVRSILRPLLRLFFARRLKGACKDAAAALYVTREALQRRYPCPNPTFSATSVQLSEKEMSDKPRRFSGEARARLIHVGTLSQLYKAPDILLRALGICVEKGLDASLAVVGDGKHRPTLEELAEKLGIRDRVAFLGMLPREEVLKKLDEADLFVLPSKTEGLPRAMLEAMARALPCIGSTAGGIPELLPQEDLVPPGNVEALAAKIMEVLGDPERMNKMSAANLAKAREYKVDVMQKEREAFYSLVKEKTVEWIGARKEQSRHGD